MVAHLGRIISECKTQKSDIIETMVNNSHHHQFPQFECVNPVPTEVTDTMLSLWQINDKIPRIFGHLWLEKKKKFNYEFFLGFETKLFLYS